MAWIVPSMRLGWRKGSVSLYSGSQSLFLERTSSSITPPIRAYGISLGEKHSRKKPSQKERIVVLGTGWAAFRFLKSVDYNQYDVKCVSPKNHFLFTPLLCSTAVGTLPFRSIIEPIRTHKKPLRFYQAHASNLDLDNKEVECIGALNQDTFKLRYDKLVIACGARNATFGTPGVEEHAMFMKQLSHAREVRNRIIGCFELANLPTLDPYERARVLTFVIVGGGPTGVEFAAELNDFFHEDLSRAYPNVPLHQVKIIVLEGSDRILSMFEKTLMDRAIRNFKRHGIEVRTNAIVSEVSQKAVALSNGEHIPCGLCIWAAGIAPVPFTSTLCEEPLAFPHTKEKRLLVNDHLQVEGHEDIYAMGDCASPISGSLPATAQVAHQQGAYLANLFSKRHANHQPFKFHYLGVMAYIGRYQGLVETPDVRMSGLLAWISWRSVYLTRLGSWKNKIQVPFDWFRTWVFGRDVTTF